MSEVIAPLLPSWISAANRRQSRSRKSPSVAVPPGTWCEIFSAVPEWAIPNRSSAGAAIPRARACRLETFIPYHPRRIAFFMTIIVCNFYQTAWCMICQACGIEKLGQVYAMSQAFRLKQSIEDAVIAGEFLPGDRLDEASLAERFGVSRTPIREALLQLGAEGFIDVRPRRGAIVSIPSPQRLIEMFETMAELEAACGTLAARRLTAEDEKLIEAAHLACVGVAANGDPEA